MKPGHYGTKLLDKFFHIYWELTCPLQLNWFPPFGVIN